MSKAMTFSPQCYARLAGALYLYIIIAGSFAALFVRGELVVTGDAAATAANIVSNEFLFRIGFSGELLHLSFDVVVAVLLYALLRPVDQYVALLATFMRIACDLVLAVASLGHFAALRLLDNSDYLMSFQPEQLQTLALLAMKLHGDAYAISLLFFAFACLALGYLVFRSGYLPKILGGLLVVAGASYFLLVFAHFLSKPLYAVLDPVIFLPIFLAEMSLALWLLLKGVNIGKWKESTERGISAGS